MCPLKPDFPLLWARTAGEEEEEEEIVEDRELCEESGWEVTHIS